MEEEEEEEDQLPSTTDAGSSRGDRETDDADSEEAEVEASGRAQLRLGAARYVPRSAAQAPCWSQPQEQAACWSQPQWPTWPQWQPQQEEEEQLFEPQWGPSFDAAQAAMEPQYAQQWCTEVFDLAATDDAQIVSSLVESIHRETGHPLDKLEQLQRDGILSEIPRDEFGSLTSAGSLLHATQECRPCVYWFRDSCTKGVGCLHCHFRHAGQRNKRIRPSKATRLRMKVQEEIVARQTGEHDADA